jgi:hypothetical protein
MKDRTATLFLAHLAEERLERKRNRHVGPFEMLYRDERVRHPAVDIPKFELDIVQQFGVWTFEFRHGYDYAFAQAVAYARHRGGRPKLLGEDGAQSNPCRIVARARSVAWNQGYRLGWRSGIRRARLGV